MYSDDMPNPLTGLQGALVLATVSSGAIASVDASAALSMPGVVAFVTPQDIKDIGGSNNCGTPHDTTLHSLHYTTLHCRHHMYVCVCVCVFACVRACVWACDLTGV